MGEWGRSGGANRGIAAGAGGKRGDHLAGGSKDFVAPGAGGSFGACIERCLDFDLAELDEAEVGDGEDLAGEGDREAGRTGGIAGDDDCAFRNVGGDGIGRDDTGKFGAIDGVVEGRECGGLPFDADGEGCLGAGGERRFANDDGDGVGERCRGGAVPGEGQAKGEGSQEGENQETGGLWHWVEQSHRGSPEGSGNPDERLGKPFRSRLSTV